MNDLNSTVGHGSLPLAPLGVFHVAGEQELEDMMQSDSVLETLPPDGLPSAPLLGDERPMVNSDWTQVENDDGEDYWWNKASGETTFDPPEGLMDVPEPDCWVVVEATDGGWDYYWNQTTGETKFDPPNTQPCEDVPQRRLRQFSVSVTEGGDEYWINNATQEAVWDLPEDGEVVEI